MREIGGYIILGVCAIIAVVIGLSYPNFDDGQARYVWVSLIAFLVLGLVLAFWPKKQAQFEEKAVGDSYSNSGTNNGHMGPITIGKTEFNLTSDHVSQVVASCPKNLPVSVMAVGSQRAFHMQATIAQALRDAGFEVELDSTAMLLPAPEGPITIQRNADRTGVIVAPNA